MSLWKFLGNVGLNGLSISRANNVASVEGLASLLKNPPGILPTE